MKITDAPSPNFGPRNDGKRPRFLILHYTDTDDAAESLAILQSQEKQVSAHYLLDEDGSAFRLVEEEMRAWHAGKSFWQGERDVNSASIGIEIQNPGHGRGYRAFPAKQMAGVLELCQGIMQRHKILPQHVLAHSDIAPLRKADPGELFPWKWLAENGVGVWPKDEAPAVDGGLKDVLLRLGYDPDVPEKELVTAFQRHFEPEVFQLPAAVGIATPRTEGRAAALLRRMYI